ncbi:cytosolic endo-beta-N-acetylglucosaminidase 2 [Agrilus planipennis]|uniref:Cytosolic endo-beta-N-acetylglucosaminidase n=1 Tax=Agrilus planipennis TaxID=224129 RepID=A0A7F5RKF8_AGRPL|nr:cytosolic endo-beta-N-acetylglucosaminidase 2 [Agrilus planipennis]XP_025836492.1 cytosolic endo-beta-N-acetylglucosaminidase 2 [Agrilus planipennis]
MSNNVQNSDHYSHDYSWSERVCSPITTLSEAWTCLENLPRWINNIIELIPRSSMAIKCTDLECHVENDKFGPIIRTHHNSVPRTLICHDMKGGYIQDKFTGPVLEGNGYAFYRWAQIDSFVYFSHHLITIPPLGWINVAHRNGVKILGTFITEWDSGKFICEEILKSPEAIKKFANILADLCVTYKIDGWLLNIENSISNPLKLIDFVEYLTRLLHIRRPGSLIIWYDSVTKDGKLSWQNELNDFNRSFFDVCDGIFVNYTWNETNLQQTVKEAKHRNLDVYIGVDVFGRNFFGGGHFNTYLAAEKIRQYNLSMAIFAQGWTHETLEKEPRETFMERFLDRDNAFWRSLWPYLYTHLPTLTFHTTFYCGSDKEYYRLNSQELQLTRFLHGKGKSREDFEVATLIDTCNCLQMHFDGKYTSCVISRGHLDGHNYVHHLFSCDIHVNGDAIIYTYTKPHNDAFDNLSIVLLIQNSSGSYEKIVCHSVDQVKLQNSVTLTEINETNSEEVINKIAIAHHYYPKEWRLRCFEVHLYDCKIIEIGAKIEKGNSVCLCGFGIADMS